MRSVAIQRAGGRSRPSAPGILVLALLGLACAGGTAPRSLAPLASDATILAFGDSLTWGTGAPRQESYPAQLDRLLVQRVVGSGVPGETTGRGAQRLPGELERVRPDLLLLCLGGNDFLQRRDPARTAANLARMIEAARTRGVPVVLVGVPKPNLLLRGGADLYAELARRYALPLDNEVVADVLSQEELRADLFHPNARGYARIAEAVRTLLEDAGAL